MTVMLERESEFIFYRGQAIPAAFDNFHFICWAVKNKLGHALTFSQTVIIQAMLGTPSVKWAQIGPGAKLAYRRVEGKS